MERNNLLLDLLKYNTEKMNFQQSMDFQLRNWAIVLTIGVLSFFWTSKQPDLAIIILHVFVIIPLAFLYYRDKNWFIFFIAFRERVKLIENILILNMPIEDLEANYFHYAINKESINTEKIKIEFKDEIRNNKWYYLIPILLVITSLILKVLCYYGIIRES
jgi:uncharacterized membrane protein